ncbi:MAG: amidohydrolase, partial [Bacteroidota bacterium]
MFKYVLGVTAAFISGQLFAQQADLIIHHANVYTVNTNQPKAEAVAIKDGKILFVGSTTAAMGYAGNLTEVIDAQGKFLMPGFIEGHGHIHGMGASLVNLNLMKAKNWEEIVSMVANAAKKAKPGDWIIGRGWHQEKWDHAPVNNHLGYPFHETLDLVSPNNPVLLTHASGHSSYVNKVALNLAGITNTTPDPSGGNIVKDKNGRIVGVLEETAQGLVGRVYSDWISKRPIEERKAYWARSIDLAEQECLQNGVTSFVDAGSSFDQVSWMKELADKGKLNIRHWVMVREGIHSLQKNET